MSAAGNGVPPGAISNRELAKIEYTMNATIRECVFTTSHLESGDSEAALDALLQIKLNAEQTYEKVERLVEKARKG